MQPTYNKGSYVIDSYHKKLSAVTDSVLITGKITAIDNAGNLVAPTIKYGCVAQQANSGEYRLKTKASDIKLQLTATAVGYLTIETEPITTQAGDSVVVNFYLSPDERPLLNCEGSSGTTH